MCSTSVELYNFHINNPEAKWFCLFCKVKMNKENLPFTLSNSSELVNLNNCDSLDFLNHLPSLETIYEASSFSKYNLPDIDAETPNLVTSKYHTVANFQKLKIEKDFNLFHSNVNGLESKYGTLHAFLNDAKSAMDVIAITETSENNDHGFFKNVSMEGYEPFQTPTFTRKGGTLMYVNSNFNSTERIDLKAQTNDFESVWVEIVNKSSKNIVCGCIYRHPRYDASSFMDYMDSTLSKLSQENKELYIMGDFNIDFLKTDTFQTSTDFYALLSSNGLLPYIIHPTRMVEGQTPSLIENIFSNNMKHLVLAGNIYITFSEHFSQFASVKRSKIDIKKIVMFGRDESNFSTESYRDDVAAQNWQYEPYEPNFLMSDFILRLSGSTDRASPVKKLSPKDIKLRLKPWITPEIRKLICVRDRLFARKKRQPNNQTVVTAYTQARNRVSRMIKKSEKEHYHKYFEDQNNNIKKLGMVCVKLSMLKKAQTFPFPSLTSMARLKLILVL